MLRSRTQAGTHVKQPMWQEKLRSTITWTCGVSAENIIEYKLWTWSYNVNSFSFSLICFLLVPPSIRGSDEVSPLTVIEGGLITLVCESSGIPPPSLTWKKDSKTFHPHHPPRHYPKNLTLSFIIILCVCLRIRAKGRLSCACSLRWASASDFQCWEGRCFLLHLSGLQYSWQCNERVQSASLWYMFFLSHYSLHALKLELDNK